jgi:hypothetical protein
VKRLIFISLFLLTIVVLAIWGDRILSRTLDAQLGPLLTRELGLPVQLAPIKARILGLKASSAKLVMGDPENPAVLATGVEVSLAWSDLLNREIRLVHVSATDLMVRPSNWPSTDSPWPDDYRFLDPWIPKTLQFETGRYVDDSGDSYPLKQVRWRRQLAGGATVNWSEDRAGGEVAFSAELKSLEAMLRLAPVELDLNIAVSGKQNSEIALQAGLKPGETSGYTLDTHVQAAGMNAHIVATHNTPWQLPDRSDTTIDKVEVNRLFDLISDYTQSAPNPEPETLLAKALPDLSLPGHQGHVEIEDLRIKDEIGKENAFDFAMSEQGLKISSITSKGPTGIWQGQFDIVSSKAGWKLSLTADMKARDAGESIAAHYLDSHWLWRTGHTQLDGRGDTWGALLNSMEGEITLAGAHRGEVETPVNITARLDNRPGEFALDQIDIQLGEGHITGTAALSGIAQRKLAIDINGEKLHLDFLFADEDTAPLPGMAIPEYLDFLPGIEIDLKLNVKDLQAPGMSLSRADIALQRAPGQGVLTLTADGRTGGKLDLRLEAHALSDNTPSDVTLTAHFTRFDIPKFFQQKVLFQSRSTGTISFEGHGRGLDEVFKNMRGKARLAVDYRRDNDWQRSSTAEDQLSFSGDTVLEIKGDRILGLQISQLDIDSFQQDVTGSVSVVAERIPWLIADLESDKLNIDGLLALMPESTAEADQTDLLTSLKKLGAMRLSLDARSVVLMDLPMSNMTLEVSSAPDLFRVDQLDFTAAESHLESHGEISWQGDHAAFKATASVTDFDLDRFLIDTPSAEHVPVSGSVNLQSEGSRFSQLLANLSGQINLHASQAQTPSSVKSRRNLVMTVKRISDGMHADISTLQLGSNELSGSVRYHKTTPPLLEVEISGGALSLLPWEESRATPQPKDPAKEGASTTMTAAAEKSASFVGKVLLSPVRFFSGPAEAAPGKKYFSDKPLPFEALKKSNAKINGRIASLTSSSGVLKDMRFSGSLNDGLLSIQASAAVNKGKGEIDATVNANATPPSAQVKVSFDGLRGKAGENNSPRSGFFYLTGQGQSPAALAATLNGTAYLEIGRGPFDYHRLSILNADVASSMFRTLIPGLDKQEPELECAVTLATFKDGTGITPYGFAARTNSANLLGRIAVDLKTEMVQLKFDSRSREGVGISVGSVFSNTVQIKGPLTDPQVVPNTTAILWRGWAAFMTAGLSVVGESVFKRALSSADPCKAIKKDIRKDICTTNQPAASSPLVCPKG